MMRSRRTMKSMRYLGGGPRSLWEDATIVDGDDGASSDEGKRSLTPNSVGKSKSLKERKHAKENGKKFGDNDNKEPMEAVMNVSK
jgi:hypothetical protein